MIVMGMGFLDGPFFSGARISWKWRKSLQDLRVGHSAGGAKTCWHYQGLIGRTTSRWRAFPPSDGSVRSGFDHTDMIHTRDRGVGQARSGFDHTSQVHP